MSWDQFWPLVIGAALAIVSSSVVPLVQAKLNRGARRRDLHLDNLMRLQEAVADLNRAGFLLEQAKAENAPDPTQELQEQLHDARNRSLLYTHRLDEDDLRRQVEVFRRLVGLWVNQPSLARAVLLYNEQELESKFENLMTDVGSAIRSAAR